MLRTLYARQPNLSKVAAAASPDLHKPAARIKTILRKHWKRFALHYLFDKLTE